MLAPLSDFVFGLKDERRRVVSVSVFVSDELKGKTSFWSQLSAERDSGFLVRCFDSEEGLID